MSDRPQQPHVPRTRARPRRPPHRTIITVDLDCFYASVAILERPHLRERPVAVVQKHLCVTTNYIARQPANGSIQKMTPVSEALSACPSLVLIDGSDLTPFRTASREILTTTRAFLSARVTEVSHALDIPQFHTPVQRHGLDELFIDVSHLVDRIIDLQNSPWRFDGHLFGETHDDAQRRALMIASQIAQKLREELKRVTGLTLCAGISSTKLLAKLAVNMHKPNEQTVFLPGFAAGYVATLPPRALMGFGSAVDRRVQAWAVAHGEFVASAADVVRLFGATGLRERLVVLLEGAASADRIVAICSGRDDSPVVDEGDAPKSLSVEDSCRDCRSMNGVREKVGVLAHRLTLLLRDDALLFGRRAASLSVGFRFRADGHKCSWRRVPMPVEVSAVLSSARRVDGAAITEEAIGKKMLTVLRDQARVCDGQVFDITLIGVGASNFSETSLGGEIKSSKFSSFFSNDDRKLPDSGQDEIGLGKHGAISPRLGTEKSTPASTENIARCPICKTTLSDNSLLINQHMDRCVRVGNSKGVVKRSKRAKQLSRTTCKTRRVDSFFKKQ